MTITPKGAAIGAFLFAFGTTLFGTRSPAAGAPLELRLVAAVALGLVFAVMLGAPVWLWHKYVTARRSK